MFGKKLVSLIDIEVGDNEVIDIKEVVDIKEVIVCLVVIVCVALIGIFTGSQVGIN